VRTGRKLNSPSVHLCPPPIIYWTPTPPFCCRLPPHNHLPPLIIKLHPSHPSEPPLLTFTSTSVPLPPPHIWPPPIILQAPTLYWSPFQFLCPIGCGRKNGWRIAIYAPRRIVFGIHQQATADDLYFALLSLLSNTYQRTFIAPWHIHNVSLAFWRLVVVRALHWLVNHLPLAVIAVTKKGPLITCYSSEWPETYQLFCGGN
jgi:hypothetical protein